MGKYGGIGSRNHGYGRSLEYAGRQVINERYGAGHYGTQAAHNNRWSDFAAYCRSYADICDMRDVTAVTLKSYAAHLREQGIAVSTTQNRLSTVNVVMGHAREGRWMRVSPSALAGKRSQVRQQAPASLDRARVEQAVGAMREVGFERAAAALELARETGVRLEEASKADLDRWSREAGQHGAVNVQDGTKGGRDTDRWVSLSDQGRAALSAAAAVRPEGSRNLIAPTESHAQFRHGELARAREVLHQHGLPGYHDARAAYACDRYQQLTGHPAPAVAGARRAPRALDQAAREQISHELGHGRMDVVASYVGSTR